MINFEIILIVSTTTFCLSTIALYMKNTSDKRVHSDSLLRLNNTIEEMKTRYISKQDELQDLEKEYAILHTKLENESRNSDEKIKLLQEAKQTLSLEFKNLANQIFTTKNESFDKAQNEKISILLKPFKDDLSKFTKLTSDQFNQEEKERYLLKNELKMLRELNERISQDAINLTNALKGENKSQGNWGELVLERILEQSGLRKDSEYFTQNTYTDEDKRMLRPDVIIQLPQNRQVVIDSKVSLTAYEAYLSCDDEAEAQIYLKNHIKSIQAHIKSLSSKSYHDLDEINSLDFTLLFMPIEGAFLLALQKDESFFQGAFDQNILVVSPSTLLVTLKTIDHIWRVQKQQDNAQEIAKTASDMLDKFNLFVDEMQKIDTYLIRAKNSYDDAFKKLKSGKGNLINRANKIVTLGAKGSKQLAIKEDNDV